MKPVTGVGAPSYTSGDLESEADQQQAHPGQPQGGRLPGGADAAEIRRAGGSVDEGDPVKEEARRKGAQEEVLEGRLVGSDAPAAEAGEHVDGDAHDLEAEEDGDQIRRTRHRHHAGEGTEQQHVVLPVVRLDLFEIVHRDEDGQDGPRDEKEVEEDGVGVHRDHGGRAAHEAERHLLGEEEAGKSGKEEAEQRHQGEGGAGPPG
jgi:hypothetical protein